MQHNRRVRGPFFLPPRFCARHVDFGLCFRIRRTRTPRCAHRDHYIVNGLRATTVLDDVDLRLLAAAFVKTFALISSLPPQAFFRLPVSSLLQAFFSSDSFQPLLLRDGLILFCVLLVQPYLSCGILNRRLTTT